MRVLVGDARDGRRLKQQGVRGRMPPPRGTIGLRGRGGRGGVRKGGEREGAGPASVVPAADAEGLEGEHACEAVHPGML